MTAIAPPIEADHLRLRHEFLAVPGLTLTVRQAARLLGVRAERDAALLEALEREGLLVCTAGGDNRHVTPPTAQGMAH